MATDLVAVEATDKLETVIQKFIDAHIHRVIVTDDLGKLIGIVSTTDVLAAILQENRSPVKST